MTLRLQADFNGLFGDLLCLSHSDTALDDTGASVRLSAGIDVLAFEEDQDDDGGPAFLVARGLVVPSPEDLACLGSRWCLRIDADGIQTVPTILDA